MFCPPPGHCHPESSRACSRRTQTQRSTQMVTSSTAVMTATTDRTSSLSFPTEARLVAPLVPRPPAGPLLRPCRRLRLDLYELPDPRMDWPRRLRREAAAAPSATGETRLRARLCWKAPLQATRDHRCVRRREPSAAPDALEPVDGTERIRFGPVPLERLRSRLLSRPLSYARGCPRVTRCRSKGFWQFTRMRVTPPPSLPRFKAFTQKLSCNYR
jgi:hypothetical protein